MPRCPECDAKLSAGVCRGHWNRVIAFTGQPGSGKSEKMMQVAREMLDTPCRIVGSDPNMNLPEKSAIDGKYNLITRYDDIDGIRRGLASKHGGIHVSGDPDCNEIVELAKEASALSLKSEPTRDRPDRLTGIPTAVLIDEIVVWKDAKRNSVGPTLEDLLARRRPHHVALLFGAQYPRMCHYSLFSQATEFYLFSVEDQKDLDRLIDGGVPEKVVSQLRGLPQYGYIHHIRGVKKQKLPANDNAERMAA